jgi:cellulase
MSYATIPATLKAGNYVLRHELIALHGAWNNDAQFYPQCINLNITGPGQAVLTGGVSGIKLYQSRDPGLVFDLYSKKVESYPFPGPEIWRGN